ncbi:hypothetical protein JCGZ_13296 [Jatropha curcas]|uniref:Uncharacterized protein n=1 Tax=Jatropha curcas TaxID=180498 RepID=A0A067K807_JATCU|nr:hypothetical protein JCGZ_13296 [Jatropha curcas]
MALIQQVGLGCCLVTGIALPLTAELTTMRAGQAAINVVLLKMAVELASMDHHHQIHLFHLDGNQVTGFALEWDVENIIMLGELNVTGARRQEILENTKNEDFGVKREKDV